MIVGAASLSSDQSRTSLARCLSRIRSEAGAGSQGRRGPGAGYFPQAPRKCGRVGARWRYPEQRKQNRQERGSLMALVLKFVIVVFVYLEATEIVWLGG